MGQASRAARARPDVPAHHVRRPRLERLLDDEQRQRVTLISGVPGAGKTTLLASWAQHREGPVAWLTLDERDNRPGAFAEAVGTALGSPLIGSDDDVKVLDRLFDELRGEESGVGSRTVLVLDDAWVLDAQSARSALTHLVRTAPPSLDVVVASRRDPVLPVGRLRLERRLGEVRDTALSFRLAEAAELFDAAGVRVRREDLIRLLTRSEGWAAGLALFASAMESGILPTALASDEHGALAVEDYMADEVLTHLDPETMSFLLRTSVVDELTVDLAVILTESPAAGHRLAALAHDGVFVTEAQRGERYRYHGLFRSLLRRRLRRDEPTLARRLHRAAARWYDVHGAPLIAEQHARTAEDWVLLGSLLQRRWLEGLADGVRLPADLLVGVPAPIVASNRALATIAAAVAHEHGTGDGGSATRPGRRPPDDRGGQVLDVVRARAVGADGAGLAAAGALAGGKVPLRRWAELRTAEMSLDLGRFDEARAGLAELADGSGSPVATEAAGLLALLDALEGCLPAARSLAAGVLGRQDTPACDSAEAAAQLALSLCETQAGRPTRAAAVAVDAAAVLPSRVLRTAARVVRAVATASSTTVVLERAVVRHPVADLALVALGVLDVQDSTGALVLLGGPDEASLRAARQALAMGGSAASVAPIVTPALRSTGPVHPRTSIDLRILAAISIVAEDSPAPALGYLREAVTVSASTGVRAPLVAPCPRLVSLLGVLAAEGNGQQRTALELLEAISALHGEVFVEELTDQERAVLGFLPTLMSNQEIASAMNLSVNTVKSHVKAVYRKLGVERRRHAVVRARQLELI